MNQATISGRLARDPEIKYTGTGKAVANFTVAVNRGKQIEGAKEVADFIPVVAWSKLAEFVGNTLSKGNEVLVSGRIQTRTWETQDGQKRYVTEIVAEIIAPQFGIAQQIVQGAGQADAAKAFGGQVFPPEEEIPF